MDADHRHRHRHPGPGRPGGRSSSAPARRRDTGEAIGRARETRKRDRGRHLAEATRRPADDRGGRSSGPPPSSARARRQGGSPRSAAPPPVPWVPPDPEALGVSRRQFLNRGIVTFFGLGLAGFGARCSPSCGPRQRRLRLEDQRRQRQRRRQPRSTRADGFAYYPEGRMWVTQVPGSALDKAEAGVRPPELAGMEAGLVALYQKCVHLGCRVPECLTSQWFECPCHGSQYNRVGEKKGGPAPAAWTASPSSVDGGNIIVDTGVIIQGPPIGTNTTGQEAEGPHCTRRRRGRTDAAAGARSPDHRRSTVQRIIIGRHRVVVGLGVVVYLFVNLRGPARGRARDRARPEPQALPRRRGARGPSLDRALTSGCSASHHRGRPAALLAGRAGPAGRRRSRTSRASS